MFLFCRPRNVNAPLIISRASEIVISLRAYVEIHEYALAKWSKDIFKQRTRPECDSAEGHDNIVLFTSLPIDDDIE
jgi:hypothetical protein